LKGWAAIVKSLGQPAPTVQRWVLKDALTRVGRYVAAVELEGWLTPEAGAKQTVHIPSASDDLLTDLQRGLLEARKNSQIIVVPDRVLVSRRNRSPLRRRDLPSARTLHEHYGRGFLPEFLNAADFAQEEVPRFVNGSAFVHTNPTNEPITSGLPVRTKPLARRTLPRARCRRHRRFEGS
jgi:hypothetical protein